MSKGATLQLAAYGAQDLYLTGNPQTTNFRSVIKRSTNFAMETVINYFHGTIAPGQRVYCDIERCGDLINQLFIQIKLPPLQPIQGQNNIFTSWANFIGFALIEYVEIQIGEHVIDKQYGQWMYIWAELTNDSASRGGLASMIGGTEVFTPATQNGPMDLYIPLYFWFCRDVGSSLPIVALQLQDIRLWVKFRAFEQLWVSNNKEEAKQIIPRNLAFEQCLLLVDNIFLDNDERRFFAQNEHMYLIEQVQIDNTDIDVSREVNIINMVFNHPVKELIWFIQSESVRRANDWFNFSGSTSEDELAPMRTALIRFDGTERIEEKEERYFRLVIPWQRHTATPSDFIYVYSFALKPEELQPSGTANFSRLDSATLHIRVGPLEDAQITIFATNYNIFRITSGLSGVLFSD